MTNLEDREAICVESEASMVRDTMDDAFKTEPEIVTSPVEKLAMVVV